MACDIQVTKKYRSQVPGAEAGDKRTSGTSLGMSLSVRRKMAKKKER